MDPDYEDILLDVFAVTIVLAAEELAEVYPQPSENGISSVEAWKRYLIQKAIKKQQSMTAKERAEFRAQHFSV